MSRLLKPARVLLLGPPGCGKGTQTSRLLKRFGISGMSSGDLLRQHIKDKTEIGSLASSIIKQGKLLPDDVMVKIIESELRSRSWLSPSETWLLDGFPRTEPQASLLDSQILSPASANLNFIVELQVPHEIILDRIANRLVHVPSGRVYNLTYNPPKVQGKDDVTGEPLSRRPDDDPEIFRQRLVEFDKLTKPLVTYYKNANKDAVFEVAGETSDIIFPQLESEMIKRFGEKAE